MSVGRLVTIIFNQKTKKNQSHFDDKHRGQISMKKKFREKEVISEKNS